MSPIYYILHQKLNFPFTQFLSNMQ